MSSDRDALWQDEFPLDPDISYLNHAAVGVWPRRTAEAVKAFADENMHRGAADYPRWMQTEAELRRQLARMIHAESEHDIALLKNTSEGLSLVAMGLDWKRGDNVISAKQEFPSNRMVWETLKDKGVELRLVDVEVETDPEGAIEALMDDRTRLLSVSSVQFSSGFRLELECLGRACVRHDVLFCIDAIQSIGALQFDAQLYHADFVVADAHKWMLGPEGLALFYSHPGAREQLRLQQYGWHMVASPGDFDATQWQPARSARRFEPGSPNQVAIQALHASLSLFEQVGIRHIEALVTHKTAGLRQWIQQDGRLLLMSSERPERQSGIVSLQVDGLDPEGHGKLYRYLMGKRVVCALRGGNIRLSAHFYTPDPVIERVKSVLVAGMDAICR